MERYKIIETISDQEYGTIAKAINLQNKQKYIVKILRKKFYTWQECIQVREVKALRIFSHPNIIKVKELIKQRDELYCVYEYYEKSLFDYYQEMRDLCDELSERQIKEIMAQIISAVHYIHDQKYFHRDLCPETISVTGGSADSLFSQNVQVKLSSFTVTREISQRFAHYTDYITTRWYRAPEQLLHSINYTHKIDIWAIGCIMAELQQYSFINFICVKDPHQSSPCLLTRIQCALYKQDTYLIKFIPTNSIQQSQTQTNHTNMNQRMKQSQKYFQKKEDLVNKQ